MTVIAIEIERQHAEGEFRILNGAPSRRAAEPPSRRAAEPPSRRAVTLLPFREFVTRLRPSSANFRYKFERQHAEGEFRILNGARWHRGAVP
jgi:hypothetical protein